MDPEKLKVVDLRKELQERGLDTKGIKAVLVKRLKDALELNSGSEVIQKNDAPSNRELLGEQNDDFTEDVKPEILSGNVDPLELEKNGQDTEEDAKNTENEKSLENEENLYIAEDQPEDITDKNIEEIKQENVDESKMESSDFNGEEDLGNENDESSELLETESRGEKRKLEEETENQLEIEHVEDKKRRGDSSVKSSEEVEIERPAKEKIPPKEDEPEIDYTKPQISWFDSDLHLKIDNKTFLSAKPLNEGCFGYVWAGARATHGISSGKVYFEAKITEELQWEDPADKMQDYRSQRYGRNDRHSHERHHEEEKRNDEKSEQIIEEKNEEQTVVEQTEHDDSKEPIENSEKVDTEELEENVEKIQPLEPAAVPEIPAETSEETDTDIKREQSEESNEQPPEEPQPEEIVEKSEDKAEILPIPTHYFRVGFSMLGTSLQLGEEKFSYAYESTGKFITNKEFKEYGLSFSVGDIVGAYLSIVGEEVTLTFTLNGVVQPTAITVPRSDFPEGFSLFPHVLCRNYAYELNLGDKEPWVSNPDELKEYQLLSTIEEKIIGPQRPESREECEIILMIGLPGSGKTHWVKNYLSSNDKQYTVIGNTPLFDRMTVEGQPMKSRFRGSWKILVDRMQKCLNQLTDQACLRRRNYIIDQTNVFPSAQRRKLRSFDGFKRKAVIVVCEDDEHFRRQKDQQSDYGKSVPESTMYDLKAQMELPQKCDWLEELIFTDLGEDEAKKKVREYNDEANKRGYFKRWQNDRRMMQRNYRQGYNRRSGYGNGRYDRYQSGPGGWNRPTPNWGRRDMRGPPPPPYRYGPGGWRQPARGPPRSSDQNRQRDNRNSGFGGVRNQNASRNQSGNRNGGSWWSNNGGNSSYGSNNHHHHHHQSNYYSTYGGYSGYGGWNQGNSVQHQAATSSSYGANQNSYNSVQGQRGYGTTTQGYSSSNQALAYGNSTQQAYGGGGGGGQSNYANSQRGYGSQAAAANNYGTQGNYGQQQQQQQNWNYYGQYSQQQQGWGTQQKRQ